MATIPLKAMPASFTAGTTVTYMHTLTDYPATLWDLKVTIAGSSQVVKPAAASGNDFVVTIEPTDTAAFAPGYYRFEERVIQKTADVGHDKKEFIIATGPLSIERNLVTATTNTSQSFEEKILAAIEAKMLGRATVDQETLQIDGTAISRIPFPELHALRQKYANLVELQRSPNAAIGSVEINFGQPSLPTIPGFPLWPQGGNW